MEIQTRKIHYKGVKYLKLIATIYNVKTITSLTTSSEEI